MKILLYTDLTIRPDQLFWHRDLGLLTQAFRDLGHEAYLVVHLATEPGATLGAPNKLAHPREQPFDMSSEALAKEEAPPERSKVWSEVGPHSEIRNSKSPIPPVLWVFQQDIRDSLWWQSHKLDLVILGLWTRPKFDTIRLAALASKVRLIERCDVDGFRLPSAGNW